MHVAIAAANQIAADAGAAIAELGGGAVDAAIAAGLTAALTEPGVCSLGGGAFVAVDTPGMAPAVVDGYMEMPGRGLEPDGFGGGGTTVALDYGGGMETVVGAGSVAIPGALAALASVAKQVGRVPWRDLLGPTIEIAREGFPLSKSSGDYLVHAADSIYGWDPRSRAALHDGDRWLGTGDLVTLPDLADFLEAIADEGVGLLYQGEAGALISEHVLGEGGILTREDMTSYEAVWREPLVVRVAGRDVATNPGPAVGGAGVVALLTLMADQVSGGFDAEATARFVEVQEAVFAYRRREFAVAAPDVGRLLDLAGVGDLAALGRSPSTVHVSAADTDGGACAITLSAGYGSGCMPPGTGLWLNNGLGELELNPLGFHALEPGTRLVSNMAPSIVVGPTEVLAIGSPGADRITSALATTLLAHLEAGLDLDEAVAHPRLHVEFADDVGARVALEPGVPYDGPLPIRPFDDLHMFFGGVTAAEAGPGAARGAADPRRGGGVATT